MPRINVKDTRRQQLMEANIASIAKRGLAETTIAHVSAGAKMSRGIVNFYFTSKENMMLQTLKFLDQEWTCAWQGVLEEAGSIAADDKILLLVDAFFGPKFCNAKRVAVWAAFIGHATTHSAYRKVIAASDDAWKSTVRGLLTESGKGKDDARVIADGLHAMLRGLLLSTLLVGGTAPNRKALTETALSYVMAVLRKKPAVAGDKTMLLKKPTKGLEGQLAFEDLLAGRG